MVLCWDSAQLEGLAYIKPQNDSGLGDIKLLEQTCHTFI